MLLAFLPCVVDVEDGKFEENFSQGLIKPSCPKIIEKPLKTNQIGNSTSVKNLIFVYQITSKHF